MSSSAGDYKPPPSWLEEGDLGPNSSHSLNQQSAAKSGGGRPGNNLSSVSSTVMKYKKIIKGGLTVATIGLSVLMFLTALLGLSSVDGISDINQMFVGVYMICFSTMLLLFEVIQLQPIVALDHMYQRNFGFLYGVKGKGFFIIFIAFLSFGLGSNSLCMLTGISMLALGGGMVGLFLKYPELFEDESS